MGTYYENHSGSVSSYGQGKSNMGRDEVSKKWAVGGYKPGAPTGGNQGGTSGKGMRKNKMNAMGSKSKNNPYY